MLKSKTQLVLLDIQKLQQKQAYLELLLSFTNKKDCRIMFNGTNRHGESRVIFLEQSDFPFLLTTELTNLFEDAIEQYERDIQTLSFKLKNI